VQVSAGVSAVQLFDSWAGALSEADYRRFVLPHSAYVLGGLAGAGVPRIHFGVGTAQLLTAMGEAGADVVGVDWRTPLDTATALVGPGAGGLRAEERSAEAGRRRLLGAFSERSERDQPGPGAGGIGPEERGPARSVQGNLDPCVLFAPWPVVEREVRRVLAEGREAPGHVFNLGHGVLPETDPEVLTRVVSLVHEASAR
jgi:uroporphyrinogen decarboxylase